MSRNNCCDQKRQGMGGHPYPAGMENKRRWSLCQNVTSKQYFTLLIIIALAFALAACGTGETAAVAPDPTEVVDSDAAIPTEEPAAQEEPVETRLVIDATKREVEVPAEPKRIVTLTEIDLDSTLALGLTPVGSVNGRGQETLPSYLLNLTGDVQSVGSIAEPNLETILALDPDLILVASPIPAVEEMFPELAKIAPVVVTAVQGSSWVDTLKGVAEMVNHVDEAESFLASYSAEAEALASSLPTDVREASIVRWNPDGPVVMLPTAFSSQVLNDIKLDKPAAQAELAGSHPVHSDPISMETIEIIDADIIFAGGLNPDGQAALEETLENPLVQALSAVQADRLVLVDGLVWGSIGGPLAAKQVLADVARGIADSTSTITETDAAETTASVKAIEHELGTTAVNGVPERIVVLEYSFADHLGILGTAPVGYALDAMPDYLLPFTEGADAKPVGTRKEPSLEAITALNPDLIIADLTRHETIYDQLSQIAPTVVYNSLRGSYQDQLDTLESIAVILEKEEQAEALLATYQKTFDAAAAETNQNAGEFMIGVLWADGFTAHSNASFMGSFLESLGRTNALEPRDGDTQYLLDLEGFASINPSTIVILCAPDDQAVVEEWQEQPVWQAFDAVKNDRVYFFNRNLWSKGRGLMAYQQILENAVSSGLLSDLENNATQACP